MMLLIVLPLVLLICQPICMTTLDREDPVLSQSWPNHDISTLKLLQVVHRHGERAIETLFPNDPYRNETEYWPEGTGELTLRGKYRMYRLGQYLRRHYHSYLGSDYSPREVYARSSAQSRCLESVQMIGSGAYSVSRQPRWQWSNGVSPLLGHLWQPFPVYTYPLELINNDMLLRPVTNCPRAQHLERLFRESAGVRSQLNQNREFLDYLGSKVGIELYNLDAILALYDTLWVEYQRGYRWSAHGVWPPEANQQILDRLFPLNMYLWDNKWSNPELLRLKAGPLVGELADNMQYKMNGTSRTKYTHKLYLYSTHDMIVAPIMHALGVWNGRLVPYGASLLVELHQKLVPDTGALNQADYGNDGYFVRMYYFNETMDATKPPHPLSLPQCDGLTDCPINKFFAFTKNLIRDDWERECVLSK